LRIGWFVDAGFLVIPKKGRFESMSIPRTLLFPWLAAALSSVVIAAPAQQAPKLDLKTTVLKEVKVMKNGVVTTERVPVETTHPGDVLVYTLTYRNVGQTGTPEVTLVDPVPKGTVYVLASAAGKDAEIACSVDGGSAWQKEPAVMPVLQPDGTKKQVPVPADRYTHLRWVIKKPCPPGQSGAVTFKTTVK